MAFNWQTFKTRTLTAIIFAAVMLTGLLWNHWSFFVLFSIIHFGCWWEYLKLAEKIHTTTFHPYTKLGLMVMGYGLMLWFCAPVYNMNGYGLKENISLPVSAAGFALLLIGIFQKNAIKLKAFGMAVLGLVYISLCWGLMIDLRSEYVHDSHSNMDFNTGIYITSGLVYIIWINDTMAYIVGSFIGKTPLSRISPKKTWEGTVGGIIVSAILIGIFVGFPNVFSILPFAQYTPNYKPQGFLYSWVIISMVVSISGTFGDLLESKLKRMAGVKDSGSLMPGHGGFMDRFDSLLLATPFVWLYVRLFMK
jgi:phosphatidate cytidylyltransferase